MNVKGAAIAGSQGSKTQSAAQSAIAINGGRRRGKEPAMEKKCFKCGEVKPLDDFYKHPQMGDGHLNKCKECNKRDVSKNYRENKSHYVEYERQRLKNPDRVMARREYQKTAAFKESTLKGNKKYRANYPEKRRAHSLVSNAIKTGKLTREPCAICSELKVEAHHKDYTKPLEVVWLCRKHHLEAHYLQQSFAA